MGTPLEDPRTERSPVRRSSALSSVAVPSPFPGRPRRKCQLPCITWMRCSRGPFRQRNLRSSLRRRILGIFLFFGSVPQTHRGSQVTDKTLRKMIFKRGGIALLFNISKLTMLKVTLIWVSPQCLLNCDKCCLFSLLHIPQWHTPIPGMSHRIFTCPPECLPLETPPCALSVDDSMTSLSLSLTRCTVRGSKWNLL